MKLRRILVGPTTVVLAAAGLGLVGPPTKTRFTAALAVVHVPSWSRAPKG